MARKYTDEEWLRLLRADRAIAEKRRASGLGRAYKRRQAERVRYLDEQIREYAERVANNQRRAATMARKKTSKNQTSMFGSNGGAKKAAKKPAGKLIPGAYAYLRGKSEPVQRQIMRIERLSRAGKLRGTKTATRTLTSILNQARQGVVRRDANSLKRAISAWESATAPKTSGKKPAAKKTTAKKASTAKRKPAKPKKPKTSAGSKIGVKTYTRGGYTVRIPAQTVKGYSRTYQPAGSGKSYSTKRRKRRGGKK